MDLPPTFYERLAAGRWQPTNATIGPWSPTLQHGGPPIALLGRALREHPSDGPMQVARLTAEIFGPLPLKPCEVEVEVVRPGKRIELLRATMRSEGRVLLMGHAWRMEPVAGISPVVPDNWTAPARPAHEELMSFPGMPRFPYGMAMEWRYVEGSLAEAGPATVWCRPRLPLVDDGPNDGLDSLLLMLDSANGVSAELDLRQWTFVPVDLTLNLTRHPDGEWFGMAARTTIADDGIGMVHTRVFDDRGPLGRSLHSLFVRPR